MSKTDPARTLLDSFNSCKHEDRSLAIWKAETLLARVEKVLAVCEKARREDDVNHPAIVGVGWLLRVLNGEQP